MNAFVFLPTRCADAACKRQFIGFGPRCDVCTRALERVDDAIAKLEQGGRMVERNRRKLGLAPGPAKIIRKTTKGRKLILSDAERTRRSMAAKARARA